MSLSAFGQIEHDVNKNGGNTESNSINDIDSIRFIGNSMEIILNNGTVESHTISHINNVTFSGQSIGSVDYMNCEAATINGLIVEGTGVLNGVFIEVDYTGGNGGLHNGQIVNSTGVTGLTAELVAGNFSIGAGTLTFIITGTPNSSGVATFPINIGGETCDLTVYVNPSEVQSLNCFGATIYGTLLEGAVANGVYIEVDYTGGNGGFHNGQIVNSTGNTGLTAELMAGNFAIGAGTLTYTITGTANSSGTAIFALNVGGQTCNLEVAVVYPWALGAVFCSDTTEIVNVTNPITGKVWMDRNLGAVRAAFHGSDYGSYGDLYQWGRGPDGHQCRNSATTYTLSASDQPGHGLFILSNSLPCDWRTPQNGTLWQGTNGINNPCPIGYRLPTKTEFDAELSSWISNDASGAYNSPLKWSLNGGRYPTDGSINAVGNGGNAWSSTLNGSYSYTIGFLSNNAFVNSPLRANGAAVRCIKD
ncbi:hypothetical protein DIT68_05715 [Brumimicrobium oceani]|uniref:Uncharacterized protein n=2 Tax=Brumimicrobium oceani TaxID=2100725 RepID=A0A2U2XE24_9FLAO|nr:hypothetical protein DIT68_05715 [Brumimicrobium oceani]